MQTGRTSIRKSLPGRLPQPKQPIDPKKIEEIKKQTRQCENERIILRTKISRMRGLIAKRDQAIKKVFTQTKDQQRIQTASPSAIIQFKRNIESLEKAKAARKIELAQILQSDSTWFAKELEIDVVMLYQEQERMKELNKTAKNSAQEGLESLQETFNALDLMAEQEIEISEMKKDIIDLKGKLDVYSHGEVKSKTQKCLLDIEANPSLIPQKNNELKREIEDLMNKYDAESVSLKSIEEKTSTKINELQKYIDDAMQQLTQAIQEIAE